MKKVIQVLFLGVGLSLLPLIGAGATNNTNSLSTTTDVTNITKNVKVPSIVNPVPAKIQNILAQQPSVAQSTAVSVPMPQPSVAPSPATLLAQQKLQIVQPVQLELELNKNIKYHVFSLPNPPRLIVDVKDNKAITEYDKTALMNTPFIKGIRTAKHENNVLRIVFDLKKDLTFTTKEEALNAVGGDGNNNKIRLIITLIDKKT